ncbi:PD-(D/E)XK nuclease family protein [Butyrivibrio sp. LC3010]|uniref:PD-(D/E)XK nuclease family protein n=1 Tax=Butyrivibrio sp. LC3010 TaxID=1280680 RepID=UPI00041C40DF|nr:PD-(D/E)XK nuclease family protein [Butyrivibrio sp. LC3010]
MEYKNYLDLIKEPAYLELYEYYSSETIMGILGVDRQENPHSSFIRWLLDINGNHGYGSSPMRKFLETVCLFKEKVYTAPDTHKLRKQDLWPGNNLLNSRNEKVLDEIKYGKYEITQQVIATEQVLSGQRRADIFSILKLEGSGFKEKNPVYLLVVIENKVHSTEHTEQTKAYAESLKDNVNKVLKKVADKSHQDWISKELLGKEKNSQPTILNLFVYLNAFPTREIKKFLGSEVNSISPLAESDDFITLNYQYLLDGVIEPLAATSKGKIKEWMNEYIRCLGQAKISLSDESSFDKNEEYLIMAVSSREKKLALDLWNNSQYRNAIYDILKSIFEKDEDFILRKREIVFWRSLANLYRFIGDDIPENLGLDYVVSKQELLDLVNTDNVSKVVHKFWYNGNLYISNRQRSLGLLFRDMVNDYIQALGDTDKQKAAIEELSDYFNANTNLNCKMFMYEDEVNDLKKRSKRGKRSARITSIDCIEDFTSRYFSDLRKDGKYIKEKISGYDSNNNDDTSIMLNNGTKTFIWRYWSAEEIEMLVDWLKDKGHTAFKYEKVQ